MALENKLGLTNAADLARAEERISKKKAHGKRQADGKPYPLHAGGTHQDGVQHIPQDVQPEQEL